jgi:hypothetical protein
MWGKRIKGNGGGHGNSFNILGSGTIWEYKTLMDRDVRNGEICMCFVCDFNGRWLNDFEPIVLYGYFIKLIVFHFF